jgi:hypothetical protein
MLRLWQTQVQKVRNVNLPQYRPDESRDGEQLLVMLDMRDDDPHAATVGNQVADTSGKDVSNPFSTGTVGQRDHVAVTAAEHIDGRFVGATAPPTTMNDDAESRKATGNRSRQVIEYLTIEACHSPTQQRPNLRTSRVKIRMAS